MWLELQNKSFQRRRRYRVMRAKPSDDGASAGQTGYRSVVIAQKSPLCAGLGEEAVKS
jgi:hypothetical protein